MCQIKNLKLSKFVCFSALLNERWNEMSKSFLNILLELNLLQFVIVGLFDSTHTRQAEHTSHLQSMVENIILLPLSLFKIIAIYVFGAGVTLHHSYFMIHSPISCPSILHQVHTTIHHLITIWLFSSGLFCLYKTNKNKIYNIWNWILMQNTIRNGISMYLIRLDVDWNPPALIHQFGTKYLTV